MNVLPSEECYTLNDGFWLSPQAPHFQLEQYENLSKPQSLGFLLGGMLDKRRDGAVRGGWTQRYFVLTSNGLYYFRHQPDTAGHKYSLLGEERGHMKLSELDQVKVLEPEEALDHGDTSSNAGGGANQHYFLAIYTKNKARVIYVRFQQQKIAKKWSKAIMTAQLIARRLHFRKEWSLKGYQSFYEELKNPLTSQSSLKALDPSRGSNIPHANGAEKPPHIIAFSIYDPHQSESYPERLITRSVELNRPIPVEEGISHLGMCQFVLSDGFCCKIKTSMLKEYAKSKRKLIINGKPVDDKYHTPYQIQIQFQISECRQASYPTTKNDIGMTSKDRNKSSNSTSTLPVALALAYVFTYVYTRWGYSDNEGTSTTTLMGMTMTLGLILSVLNILRYGWRQWTHSSSNADNTSTDSQSHQNMKPNFPFTITLLDIQKIDPESSIGVKESKAQEPDNQELGNQPEEEVPQRFIDAEKGNYEKGKARWLRTLEWRASLNIDRILDEPHVNFETIKKYYKQYFHGRSKDNHPVYYEMSGKIDLASLKTTGLHMDHLENHFIYTTEYLWQIIDADDSARSVTILDISGLGFSDVGGEALEFIKKASAISGNHYPERSAHIFIVNVPSWFSMVWGMIKPLIDPVTREKIHMVRGKTILKELSVYIDVDQIPSNYGGSGVPLGESQEEKDMALYVKSIIDKSSS